MDGKQPTRGRKITFTTWSCSFAPTISSMATLRLAILDTALIYQYRTRLIIRLPLISVIVNTGRTDKWVISRLLSVWTGPPPLIEPCCCLCIHIPHYPHPNPNPKPNPKSCRNLKLFNELAPYIQLDRHLYNECLGAFLLTILTIT